MTVVCVERGGAASPILVSLAVEASVYLYSAEIEPDRRSRTRLLSRSKTESSATWTDLIDYAENGESVTIGVNWVIVDSLCPGRRYTARLSVLDEAGEPLAARAGSSNPVEIPGRIGPAGDPTDSRRVSIVIG